MLVSHYTYTSALCYSIPVEEQMYLIYIDHSYAGQNFSYRSNHS